MRHRHPVDLGQNVVGEPGGEVHGQDPAQRIQPGNRLRLGLEGRAQRRLGQQLRPDQPAHRRLIDPGERADIGAEPILGDVGEEGAGAQRLRQSRRARPGAPERAREPPPQPTRQQPAHPVLQEVVAGPPIAREVLVAAIAREHHRHLPARRLADQPGGRGGAVGERAVMVPGDPRQECRQVDPGHRLMQPDLRQARGDRAGVGPLVQPTGLDADHHGIDRAIADRAHRPDHRGGIEPAGQEGAERDLAHQMTLDRRAERPPQPLRIGRHRAGRELQLVMPGDAQPARLPAGAMAGWQTEDAPVDRGGCERIAQGRIVGEAIRRERRPFGQGRQDRLDLGAEQQGIPGVGIEQRLDAERVAGQMQRPLAPVIKRKGEHAAQAGQHRLQAPGQVAMQDDLAVAAA